MRSYVRLKLFTIYFGKQITKICELSMISELTRYQIHIKCKIYSGLTDFMRCMCFQVVFGAQPGAYRLTKLFSIDTMLTDLEALTLLNCFSFSRRSKIRWAGYFDVYTFETSAVHSVVFLLSKPFSFIFIHCYLRVAVFFFSFGIIWWREN